MYLPSDLIESLQELPESGMGYHIINVELEDGNTIEGVVVSTQGKLLGEYNFSPKNISEITNSN